MGQNEFSEEFFRNLDNTSLNLLESVFMQLIGIIYKKLRNETECLSGDFLKNFFLFSSLTVKEFFFAMAIQRGLRYTLLMKALEGVNIDPLPESVHKWIKYETL